LRDGSYGQSPGNAVTARIRNARFSCLESVLCGALLGKSPFVSALFANLTIDKTHQTVLNLILTE